MESCLKKQADTYFQTILDFEKTHNEQARAGKLPKFYTLLLIKYLLTQQLTHKIICLHTNKTIQWNILLDVIWGLSLCFPENGQYFKALSEFVSEIDRKNLVSRSFLIKSLPENLIDFQNFEKKQTLEKNTQRAYRKLYYDQKKHNLFRENNQGFAKLCLLLATVTPSHNPESVWNKILSLIGNFDLDPDRVLDLLIQTYVQSKNSQIHVNFIKYFNPQSIATLIGNKILQQCPPEISQKILYAGKVENFLMTTSNELYRQFNHFIHHKLIILLCTLIKQNTISLQSIFPYLNPQDVVFQREQTKRLHNGKQQIIKSFKLIMEEQSEHQQLKIREDQNLKFLGQMLFSSKLALINGFVIINDWRNFMKLWNTYHGKIDLLIYQPLIKSLLSMLQWIIEPLYSKISYAKYYRHQTQKKILFLLSKSQISSSTKQQGRKQMAQITLLNEKQFFQILQIFEIIKIYIGFHSKCYIKICRLFASIIKQPNIYGVEKPTESMTCQNTYSLIKEKIQHILQYYLFPGLSLQNGNSAMTKQIYQLLQLFDYRFRYKCYLYHYSQGMTINPYLSHIFFKTRNKQIIILNNLSDKNKKIYMKKIAKLTHNQALQTFYWIFRRILIADYEKVVPQIVAVLSICCPLTLQISIFVALHILNEQKQPAMNFKTGEQQPWFKNIINFISLFYRKYLQIDIQPVFDYIIMKISQPVQELQENEQLPGSLLKLLHEILSKMFCNFILKQVNKNKLQMLCAGPRLQLEAMDISEQIKASKKSKVILQKFFWGKSVDQYDGQSLAISLLVLLTQKRAEVLHKSYISKIKIIGDIYDDFTVIIIQLIRVLNELSSGYTQYAKLLPENALNLLINQYKLPVEIVFEIYRPSIKHISMMTNEQWIAFANSVGEVMSKYINSDDKYITRDTENEKLKIYLNENYQKMPMIMSNEFFTTFWMLTLDSIYFPAKLYTQKIEQVKKKIEIKPITRNYQRNEKNEREIEKLKILLLNIKNQENQQQKKVQDTINEINLNKFKIQYLKNGSKDDKNSSIVIQQFAEIFVQICLIPRMMLDPEEALYCMKITMEVIKVNKLSSGKSIKLLICIIEHVMNYLPYSTQRQAAYCLSIFLSEILSTISNWNDVSKLKQDMKKFLAIEENFIEESYLRLKKHFLRLYIRFGNIVKSIKDQPYSIRNCLYLLQKVQSIPAYKKQAEDLENYLKLLKQKYWTILPTIIQMQLLIIGQKKKTLPIIEQQGQLLIPQKNQTFFTSQKITTLIPKTKIQQIDKKSNGDENNKEVIGLDKIDEQKQHIKLDNDKNNQQLLEKQKINYKQTQITNEKEVKTLKSITVDQMIPQRQQERQNNIGNRQVDQKQKENKQKKIQQMSRLNQSLLPIGSTRSPQKSCHALTGKLIGIQKVEKQKQKVNEYKQQQPPFERTKTVKEVRDESERKKNLNILNMQQMRPKQNQPQINQSNTASYVRTLKIKQESRITQKLDSLISELRVKKKQGENITQYHIIWTEKQWTRNQKHPDYRGYSNIERTNLPTLEKGIVTSEGNSNDTKIIKNTKNRLINSNNQSSLQNSSRGTFTKHQPKKIINENGREKYGYSEIERRQNRMDQQKLEAGQLESEQQLTIVQKIKLSQRQTGKRSTTNPEQMEGERRLQRKIQRKQQLEIKKRQRQRSDEDDQEIRQI